MKDIIVANRDIRSIILIALILMVFAASMCSAEKIGYYPGSGMDIYSPFELTDVNEFIFVDDSSYVADAGVIKNEITKVDNKFHMNIQNLAIKKLEDGTGYMSKHEITFEYKNIPRRIIVYKANANTFYPKELENGYDILFTQGKFYLMNFDGTKSRVYSDLKVGGTSIAGPGWETGQEEALGFETNNKLTHTSRIYITDEEPIDIVTVYKVLKKSDITKETVNQIFEEKIDRTMKALVNDRKGYEFGNPDDWSSLKTPNTDSLLIDFKKNLDLLKTQLGSLQPEIRKKIALSAKSSIIDANGVEEVAESLDMEGQYDLPFEERKRFVTESNKLFDDFLRELGLLARAAGKAIRITETTVEVLQADGTTKTYNSHAEFMAAPAADRTIGGQRIDLIENEMQVAGEAVHIGPNRYYEGVPAPGETRLVQDPTVIEEVIVTELPDGTAHYDLHVTHTDADGSIYRSRVRTDASGTVIESEILDGTRLSKIGRLKSVMGGLRNSRVVRLGTTGAEYVGVFGHGLILAIAVNGIYYGEWKWVAPELATVTVTGIFLKAGATALRANLIGTIVGSIFELGIYAWEERDANEIKAEFGIEQTSAWDTVKGGLGRMAESYRNLLKLFTTPDNEYGMALEDKIVGDMDTYLAENYEAKGITPGQIQQLKEQLMRNGQYSQKYHEQLIVPLESGLFDIEDLNGDYLKGGYSPTSNPEELAKVLNIRMCVLLEELQVDKELPKVGVYIDEKSFREVMDKELFWWKTQLVNAQNGLEASKKQKTVPDPNSCGIGINRILESPSGDTIIEDDRWGGDSFDTYYINADKGKGFIDDVRKSLEGMNCEDISEDLQYRVFVKNNFEEDVTCDKGVNTATLKWEIKTGTECDKADGYTDLTTSICKETAPLKVERGSDVEAFCTSDQIKAKYPKKSGPYCVRVTWCGESEVFKYGGKEEEKLKIMSDQGSSKGAGGGTDSPGSITITGVYEP